MCCNITELLRLRLRDMHSNTKKGLLKLNHTMDDRQTWYSQLYLQIVTGFVLFSEICNASVSSDERVIGATGDPIFVRRFRPSTVEVRLGKIGLESKFICIHIVKLIELLLRLCFR